MIPEKTRSDSVRIEKNMDSRDGISKSGKVTSGMGDEKRLGIVLVMATYIMWGCLPVFWKTLEAVPAVYILCARVVWSLGFCMVYLTVRRKWERIREILKDRWLVLRCGICGVVVCINWGSYIWAVNNGHLLDSSFGYYMNPILVVVLGVLCFRERLSIREWTAVGLSAAGVLYLVVRSGTVPVLAMVIGGSFAVYGMIKKGLPLGSDESLFLETLLVSPVALGYMIYAEMNGMGAGGILHGMQWGLLPLAGIITAFPLLVYTAGVKKIPFYLTGILMYLNPTIQFLMGIFLFKEAVNVDKIISFVFIWAGVLLMIIKSGVGNDRKQA